MPAGVKYARRWANELWSKSKGNKLCYGDQRSNQVEVDGIETGIGFYWNVVKPNSSASG